MLALILHHNTNYLIVATDNRLHILQLTFGKVIAFF